MKEETKKISVLQRVIALLLCLIMLIGIVPAGIVSAEKMDIYQTAVNVYADHNFTYPDKYHGGTCHFTIGKRRQVYKRTSTNEDIYCITCGRNVWSDLNDYSTSRSCTEWDNLPNNVKVQIARVIALGESGQILGKSAREDKDIQAVVQNIVHEILAGYRDPQSGHRIYTDFETYFTDSAGGSIYKSRYQKLSQALEQWITIPSFMSYTSTNAKTYLLQWDGSKYSATITDNAERISKMNFSSVSGLTITKSGNKLILSSTNPIPTATLVSASKDNGVSNYSGGAWVASVGTFDTNNTAYQSFVLSNAKPDPVNAYFKVKTEMNTPPKTSSNCYKTFYTSKTGQNCIIKFKLIQFTRNDDHSVSNETEYTTVTKTFNNIVSGQRYGVQVDNLPTADSSGKPYKYRWEEEIVSPKDTWIERRLSANELVNIEITKVPFRKIWLDGHNEDNTRPYYTGSSFDNFASKGTSVQLRFKLQTDAGDPNSGWVDAIQERGLIFPEYGAYAQYKYIDCTTANNDENNGKIYYYENLPKYNLDGQEIHYRMVEDGYYTESHSTGGVTEPEEYQKSMEDQDGVFTLINRLMTNVTGTKTWKDDGNHPEQIQLELWRNGEKMSGQVILQDKEGYGTEQTLPVTIKPDENGEWSWNFINLPRYADDGVTKYTYEVKEISLPGYYPSYDEDGNITNVKRPILSLKKKSANPQITDGNRMYSMKGAQYGIYSDAGCSQLVATLTTNADGNTQSVTLDNEGTYYVKEIKRPEKGYAMSATVKSVTLKWGESKTVEMSEPPQTDIVDLVLRKVNTKTHDATPVNGKTLEGAIFEIKYFDVPCTTNVDPETKGETPKATWQFRTDSEGKILYDAAHKVSGNDLYNSNGTPVLPLGTVTIREIKPPEGYLKDNTVYVRDISANTDKQNVQTYNAPTVSDKPLNLKVLKVQDGTQIPIPGAEFTHTKPDGKTETLRTGTDGTLTFEALGYGTHSLKETSVPAGYVLNTETVTFTVTQDNTVTFTSKNSENITCTVKTDGAGQIDYLQVNVEEELKPFTLKIHKINDAKQPIAGAEFTLYADKGRATVLQKGTTDQNGNLTFANLQCGVSYYLAETKAPAGYRLPLDQSGKPVLTELRFRSVPVQGIYELYIDGKKQEFTGDFALENEPDATEVTVTVTNRRQDKLPATGSFLTPLLIGAGLAVFAGAVMLRGKKRKRAEKE